jgi:peptide/nickel transport system ATP-binding protein/oligopeptide transport system ATP-binding protein
MFLIETKGLKKYFPVNKPVFQNSRKFVKAVDDVNIFVSAGETLGLVGESGCGKSTLGRILLHLLPATDGEVFYNGENITFYNEEKIRNLRRSMQIIFQDPYSALNPRMTVFEAIKAPLNAFAIGSSRERDELARRMMERVGLRADQKYRFPHEFSGGQRQRVVIARALVLNPRFVVCDEPVSALDVSVRSQVINLMRCLQEDLNLTYLFISHDLSVIKHLSNRVAVMYLGRIVELAGKDELFRHALHPYTEALMSAILVPSADSELKPLLLKGETPSPVNLPAGCRFAGRCPRKTEKCTEHCETEEPVLREVGADHWAACHLL